MPLHARLPDSFLRLTDAVAIPVDTGMSQANVWRIEAAGGSTQYLKLAEGEGAAALRREIERTVWLAARGVRVPAILQAHEAPGFVALLSGALPGTSASELPLPVSRLMPSLGRGLAKLHSLSVRDCPFDETARRRLSRAARLIADGEIDAAEFSAPNQGVAPLALWQRLAAQIPTEDLVVAHGDATLANMIVEADGSLGFVDCGHCGVADRYLDLAVAAQDIADTFGEGEVAAFAAAYGAIDWDADKVRFFTDLYELF